MHFSPVNIFQYQRQVLQLDNGQQITYAGALPWRVYEKAPTGHPAYIGRTLFETNDCLDLCYWLNMHRAAPSTATPEAGK